MRSPKKVKELLLIYLQVFYEHVAEYGLENLYSRVYLAKVSMLMNIARIIKKIPDKNLMRILCEVGGMQ